MATEQQNDLSIDEPDFYDRAFTYAAHERKAQFALEPDNFRRVCRRRIYLPFPPRRPYRMQDSCLSAMSYALVVSPTC